MSQILTTKSNKNERRKNGIKEQIIRQIMSAFFHLPTYVTKKRMIDEIMSFLEDAKIPASKKKVLLILFYPQVETCNHHQR